MLLLILFYGLFSLSSLENSGVAKVTVIGQCVTVMLAFKKELNVQY